MQFHGPSRASRPQCGFTVLELMVTVSIAGLLLVTGIPSFQNFSQQQHIKAAVASLQNDLMIGRSEAVHLNARVVSCPGSPVNGCSGDTEWSDGWIVFADSNADRQHQPGEFILRHGHGFENLRIVSSTGRTSIRFFPDGSTPGSNGNITFCGLGGPDQARKLIISNLGRVRREAAPDMDTANCPR